LALAYCFKFKAILKSWPNVKVCLLFNSCWLIFSKIENVLVVLVGLVALVVHVTLVAQFWIFELKFLLRLVLPKVFLWLQIDPLKVLSIACF
jgi:hypothetical protein